MSKVLIAISTYQKIDALEVLLDSLHQHGYFESNKVVVCDDNQGKSYTLTKKDNPNHPCWGMDPKQRTEFTKSSVPDFTAKFNKAYEVDIEVIFGSERGGVAINKNRGIKYFLEHREYDELLLLDDDIVFTAPGILEAIRACGEPHMTGLLGGREGEVFGEEACPFFQSFPPMGETPTHWYCLGSMGMMLWYTRECIERVGYMDQTPGKYGFEHSLHSGRINMLYGKYIDWFPILKGCEKYFHSQSIPNNYVADFSQNQKYYLKRKEEIFRGVDLQKTRGGV